MEDELDEMEDEPNELTFLEWLALHDLVMARQSPPWYARLWSSLMKWHG